MNFYNCGFYLGYLDNLHKITDELELESVLKCLCTFSCETITPPKALTPMDSKLSQLIAVYENLLSRGLPTFPSLLVERTLTQLPSPDIAIHEQSETGSFEFLHKGLDATVETEWLDLLKRAHYIVDPRLTPESELPHYPFDSEEEQIFFSKRLPQYLAEHITLLVEPQRPFETLIDPEKATDKEIKFCQRRRVDFALETDKIKVVFEVDGEHHQKDPQLTLDEERDRILEKSGWKVLRIPTKDVRENKIDGAILLKLNKLKAAPFFDLTGQNYCSPLWETELGQKALQLVLTPFAVARLQKTLLFGLRTSALSLNHPKWKLVVVERDVPCAQLAILDFLITLKAFYSLLEIDTPLPKIELLIYTTPEFKKANSGVSADQLSEFNINTNRRVLGSGDEEAFEGDLLIDISMLQRYGFTKPESDFCDRLLGANGVAFSIRSTHTQGGTNQIQPSEPIAYPMADDKRGPLRFFLQNLFRKTDFREGQFEILTRSLARKSVIGLLPTGAGKSLCYQLSALLQPGVTLVVDPLRSLMFDQAENLKTIGIDRIAFINSELTRKEKTEIELRMGNGEFQIVFVSPERLQIKRFREALRRMTNKFSVPYVVIDEAHCVSEWGHDFRTAYLNLASTVQAFCRFHDIPPTIVALTGTASYAVLADVQREIGIPEEEAKIYPSTFDRPELKFKVDKVLTKDKQWQLSDIFKALPGLFWVDRDSFFKPNGHRTYSGIVFVPHVDKEFGEEVRTFLSKQLGICRIEFYSSGAPETFTPPPKWDEHKRMVQQEFKTNEFPLLVSTNAFGMGIDKPNIRYTIHYGMPKSLEAFYQEAGRAGRDRKGSICAIIFSDDNAAKADKFLDKPPTIDELKKLPWSAQGDIHRMLWFHIRAFQGATPEKLAIHKLLEGWIHPCLNGIKPKHSKRIQIPYNGKSENEQEKAIYRLAIIGVVQDYTKDFDAKQFEVTIVKRPEAEYLAELKSYIDRYKTQDGTAIDEAVKKRKKGKNLIEKCLGYLIEFVYDEIEKKRRRAIQTMAEVARDCPTDATFREALLNYLEKSPFTEHLLKLARRIEPEDWWKVLDIKGELGQPLLNEVDGARQLLGGCRRTLESDPDHPGLYFLSGFARLLLSTPEVEQAPSDIRSGFQNLTDLPVSIQEEIALQFLDHFKQWSGNIQNFDTIQADIAETVLDELPTRTVTRAVYDMNPDYAERILLNLMFQDVENFNQQFLGGT